MQKDELILYQGETKALKAQMLSEEARYHAKIGKKADFLAVSAKYQISKSTAIDAKINQETAWGAFSEIAGELPLKLAKKITLDHLSISERSQEAWVTWVTWVTWVAQKNLNIQEEQISVNIAKKRIKEQKAAYWPTLDLVVRKSLSDSDGSEFGDGNRTDTETAELRLDLPLYAGGAIQANIRQASHQLESAEASLNSVKRQIKRQTLLEVKSIENAKRKMTALDVAIEAQALALKAVRAGYPVLYSSLEVVDA